jgi:tetratricopeptide (TPR) repeat protein
MKSKERHQLKQNDFAATALKVAGTLQENQSRTAGIALTVVVAILAIGGFFYWRGAQADRAGAMLAIASSTAQAPIAPPSSLPGATQAPGTFTSEKARSEAALKAYQEVAAAYPSSKAAVTANYAAAGELLDLNRLVEAEALYNKVIAANSPLYTPMARLGIVRAKLEAQRYDEAAKLLTDLSGDRDGTLPVDGVLMQLAEAYAKAGKPQDARAAYKRVVDEFSESVYAADARQRMATLN